MKRSQLTDSLWGENGKTRYLFIAAFILLFTFLGGRDIWTQEHRWADIVATMFQRHDFLHPYLGSNKYYDKPLLSYWLIVLLSKIIGTLNLWALRLPSALAGLLSIWSIYRLGSRLKNRSLGLLSGWLLLTTYYFVFWARISSADMLNLAGSLFAVTWYFIHKEKASFYHYSIFFIIIALTSLCKGLVGLMVPALAVTTDILLEKSWRLHLRIPFFLSLIPAVIIYLAPFLASSYVGGDQYGQNGLYLVYRENILRYFQPFDHQGPFYTYLIYLPVYLLPWAIFFIPALIQLPRRWHNLSLSSRWIAWATFVLFLFFSLSGSRRSYYVLPLVPLAILFTADWILSFSQNKRAYFAIGIGIISSFFVLLMMINILPTWYYSQYGAERFAELVKKEASKVRSWQDWNIVFLDAESKLNFYLQYPKQTVSFYIKGTKRLFQTKESLLELWPILENPPAHTIFISRQLYASRLQSYLPTFRLLSLPHQIKLFSSNDVNTPIAFIPVN